MYFLVCLLVCWFRCAGALFDSAVCVYVSLYVYMYACVCVCACVLVYVFVCVFLSVSMSWLFDQPNGSLIHSLTHS